MYLSRFTFLAQHNDHLHSLFIHHLPEIFKCGGQGGLGSDELRTAGGHVSNVTGINVVILPLR